MTEPNNNSAASDLNISAGSLIANARKLMDRCTMGSAGWWSAFDELRRLENH